VKDKEVHTVNLKVRRRHRLLAIIAFTGLPQACAQNSLEITANIDAELLQVGLAAGEPHSLGALPKTLTSHHGMEFLILRKPGFRPIKILLPMAEDLSGGLNLTMRQGVSKLGAESQHDDLLLDRLLMAHREFLRGQLEHAKTQLDAIEHDCGGTFYGLLILRANIAYLERNFAAASRDYASAQALLPDQRP